MYLRVIYYVIASQTLHYNVTETVLLPLLRFVAPGIGKRPRAVEVVY